MSYKNYLTIKKTPIGDGVFTNVQIPAKTPILEFKGDLYNRDTLKHDHSHILQVGPDLFLGPSGDIDDIINHSCSPNCFLYIVGNRAILYSLYVISADSELTFDYSTSSNCQYHEWLMECLCGNFHCRKFISGYQYLDDKIKKDYKNLGAVPLFLKEEIFK